MASSMKTDGVKVRHMKGKMYEFEVLALLNCGTGSITESGITFLEW